MASLRIEPAKRIAGKFVVPSDKSISHRAAILAALAHGATTIHSFLKSRDCIATLRAVQGLGVRVEKLDGGMIRVHGGGLGSLRAPNRPLDLGNSGTGMRLLTGLIAGQPLAANLTGDASLRRRPMARIVEPLKQMGASVFARDGKWPPLQVRGGGLRGIRYAMPVASAQVKSAILLAAMQAEGQTTIEQPGQSRDHTERMIRFLSGTIEEDSSHTLTLRGPQQLSGREIRVPGDISSAAYLLAAALLLENSQVTIEHVGLNPTRIAFLTVLEKMGAKLAVEVEQNDECEPAGSVRAETSALKGIRLDDARIIPNIIDEIPMLAVLAARADGTTEIHHAEELRVKESDRIRAICKNLRALGTDVEELPDGMRIVGKPGRFQGGAIDSAGDHRIAMAFAVAGLSSEDGVDVSDAQFINTSFPGFAQLVEDATQ